MKILVFAGAGTSVELGVPAMREMVVRLSEHLHERQLAPALAMRLAEFLITSPEYDMEELIDQLDSMTGATEAYAQWGSSPLAPIQGLSVLRQEAEWYVNHICERVDAGRAELMWGATLAALASNDSVIVTTNYDRAIEMAAARRSIKLDDGFDDFADDEWTRWRGFARHDEMKLLKVHGSTDWYHSAEGDDVWKLRHPMALFGRVTMQVEAPSPLKLRSAAILPSREKKSNLHPYPELAFEFRRALDEADLAIFLGTSLRDPDMRALFRRSINRIATFLVGPSAHAPDSAGGTILRHSASKFLCSTMPTALVSADPAGFLKSQAHESQPDEGILDDLVVATHTDNDLKNRCDAIERLADVAVSFPPVTILPLLHDEDSAVRTYALALIASGVDNSSLIAEAKAIADSTGDASFRQEIQILESSLGPLN